MRHGGRVFAVMPAAMLLAFLFGFSSPAGAVQEAFVEHFTTTTYRNPLFTTANWNVDDTLLELWPYHAGRAGQCYLAGDQARGVAVDGDFAYVAADAGGLKIVNISNPTSPALKSTCDTPGNAYDVALSRDYAFVADGASGLQAVDISDPSFPSIVGTCNTPGTAYGVAIYGDYAYVADDDSIQVIDISDPTDSGVFKCIGSAVVRNSGNAYNLCADGKWLFVAAHDGYFQVFNISNPARPILPKLFTTSGFVEDVVVCGDLAYLAISGNGMQIVDVSNGNPSALGSCGTPGINLGLAVSGDWVYTAASGAGVQVINARNSLVPGWADSCATPQNAYSLAVDGEYAYVAAGTAGLEVIRVAEQTPPLLADDFYYEGSGQDILVRGDNAFVAAGNGGFMTVNMMPPDNPQALGVFARANANAVTVDGDHAYVTDAVNNRLWVMNVADLSNPDSMGCLDFVTVSPLDVAVVGMHAYVAAGMAGVKVVSLRNPGSPTVDTTYNTPGTATSLAIAGDYLFVADGGSGLCILDISNPTAPSLAGSVDTPGYAYDVAVSGEYAYVADGSSGLQVVDTDSLFVGPRIVGAFDTPGVARSVTVRGDFAAVADLSSIQIINVTNPSTPYTAGSVPVFGTAQGIDAAGDFAFVTFTDGGMGGIRNIQVFQRNFDTVNNQAQSTIVPTSPDTIMAVRVYAPAVDTVDWYVSADGGETWNLIPRDECWHALSHPGNELVWRSRHYYRTYGANPCTPFVEIQLKYDYGVIDSLKDVAEDEGGWLRVRFNSSALDYSEGLPGMPPDDYGVNQAGVVSTYFVHRRIDDIGFSDELLHKGTWIDEGKSMFATLGGAGVQLPATLGCARALAYGDRCFYSSPAVAATQEFPPGLWEVVAAIPAMGQPVYYSLVPSASDSMSAFRYTVFCVTTHMSDPSVFYFSPPDSGYSLDNLPPASPRSPKGEYEYPPPVLYLTWDRSTERDFSHYAVYKGNNPDFVPSPTNRVGAPWDTFFVDEEFVPDADRYYKISAWDIHENEGAFSLVGPENMTHVDNPPRAPVATRLEQNSPNPFNPTTAIEFSVARPGRVTLRVYDVSGRCVRTLADVVMDASWYMARWDGRDDEGRNVPSGVYVYKLTAPYHREARKMVLAR